MTPLSLQLIASAIESFVIVLAILIGGGWTLYSFVSLGSIEKARAELEKLKQSISQRGILQITLMPSQMIASDGSGNFINVGAKITNVGNGRETIKWRKSYIKAALVTRSGSDLLSVGAPIEGQQLYVEGNPGVEIIAPGESGEFSYLIPVSQPGIYLLDALFTGSAEETEAGRAAAESAGLPEEEHTDAGWGARAYFNFVDPTQAQPPSKNP